VQLLLRKFPPIGECFWRLAGDGEIALLWQLLVVYGSELRSEDAFLAVVVAGCSNG